MSPTFPSVSRFVAYFRVSTDKQGWSDLGLEAQRAAVEAYVAGVALRAAPRVGLVRGHQRA